jgi:glucose-1-phosphate cytidylyltransferase
MKVILLAGGFGTRLAEYTDIVPKPLVRIGNKPILWHIMNYYAKFNHKDFYVALGYKAEMIKEFFINYNTLNSDFTINLGSGKIDPHLVEDIDWNVTLIHTGANTMTGGRVKRLRNFIGNNTFMLTYGDGLTNVDINALLAFHKSHGKMITLTAVRPTARFGELVLNQGQVKSFEEKPQLHEGWINGGYFVIEPDFFDLIDGDDTMLEREPLEKAVQMNQLMAYKHSGFWQCMDNKRDHDILQKIWEKGNAPWDLI